MKYLKKYWIAIVGILVLLVLAIIYFRNKNTQRQVQQTGYRQVGKEELEILFIDVPGSEQIPDTTNEYTYTEISRIN